MTPPDSSTLQLDEHLARLLAAYDQGIGDADPRGQTLDLPAVPGERLLGPLTPGVVNEGSANDALPDPDRTRPLRAQRSEPQVSTPPPSGTTPRIGRFELRRQLGKGGCGIVFLAFDPKLHREVALKIPRPEMLLSPDARRRLIREALAAAEFDHPNLVPVYETGEIGPVCFIATAFCPGQTLAEWIDRQAFPVPVRQAARLVATIAEAVQHAHDRGVLHRDLKPNNVILQETKIDPQAEDTPPGSCPLRGDHFVPRVVDFGLAKLSERGPSDTGSRQILGTPKYMAPEMAQGRQEDVGPAADVYALGVMLYELVAGRAPYEGASDVEVLRLAVEGNLTHPRSLRRDLSRDLEAICLKAMALAPGKRYRTAIDLADDLRRFLDGRPTLARPLKWPGRAARWLRRNDQLVALATVSTIAFFALGVGVWILDKSEKVERSEADLKQRELQRARADRQRDYSYHIRAGFHAWRNGDARQMDSSLRAAEAVVDSRESPEFAWGYLARLGRVDRMTLTSPSGSGPPTALAVSPDGARVVTGHPDGTLAVWDRSTGQLLGSVKAHPVGVAHAAFAAGGKVLVTAGAEPVVRTWAVEADGAVKPGLPLPALPEPVTCLAAAADGTAVFVGSAKGTCLGWDPTGGRPPLTWRATAGERVVALAVSPDGRTVATASPTGPVRLWSAATAAPDRDIRAAAGATALAFIPAPTGFISVGAPAWWLAAAGRDDGTIRVLDRDGREIHALTGHSEPILSLATSPDGKSLASGGQDAGVCVWDLETGGLKTVLRGHTKPVRGVRFVPDGSTLCTASDDGQVKAWDLTADPEGRTVHDLPAAVTAIAVHRGGRQLAIGYADGSVHVYADRDAPPRKLPGNGRAELIVLRFPEAGPPVGVELAGRAAVVWTFGDEPRRVLRVEAAGGGEITRADLSADGTRLAVGDDTGVLTVWSVPDRTHIAALGTGLPVPVRHLALSPDGRRVAALTAGYWVGVWDVADPLINFQVPGHGEGLRLVRFLPDGNKLVTAGLNNSIRTWLPSGREELQLLGHVGRVHALAVSPDGRTLASASQTGAVKLWDLRTGQELLETRRHRGPVRVVEFTPDGRLMLTGGVTARGKGELAFWESGRD
jgi:WD40 repeat protein/serine/threonine protein kinase